MQIFLLKCSSNQKRLTVTHHSSCVTLKNIFKFLLIGDVFKLKAFDVVGFVSRTLWSLSFWDKTSCIVREKGKTQGLVDIGLKLV